MVIGIHFKRALVKMECIFRNVTGWQKAMKDGCFPRYSGVTNRG